jgi:aminomethyltransferase
VAQANEELKKTALYDLHKAAGAKMVPFAGWLMPVSYAGVLAEHQTVRERCGVFDVSHMGEVFVTGPNAGAYLQRMTVNDITRLTDGSGQYSALLDETGGMIDDIIVYRLKADEYLICVNASNVTKDFEHLARHADGQSGVKVANQSNAYSQIAVQGPRSKEALQPLIGAVEANAFKALEYMRIMPATLFGHRAYVARTGYTGEWGYELYVPNEIAARVWIALMESRHRTGIDPVGLGARDTLRLEACYLLYGNDMNDSVSPLEAGISWAVRLEAADFLGRDALLKQKASGLTRQSFAFKMEEDGIPRHDMPVYSGNERIGTVTSGSVLPTVGGAGGLALLDPRVVKVGDTVTVDIRGKRRQAKLVPKPLYKAKIKG